VKLTRIERWILAAQYGILERMDSANGPVYRRTQEALEHGWELEYESLCPAYKDEETLSEEGCREVVDVLSMYRSLDSAAREHAEISEGDVAFPGFDGNEETRQWSYARFLVSEGKFTESDKGHDLNSHFPVLEGYRQMLREWQASAEKYNLTGDDVRRILAARDRA